MGLAPRVVDQMTVAEFHVCVNAFARSRGGDDPDETDAMFDEFMALKAAEEAGV